MRGDVVGRRPVLLHDVSQGDQQVAGVGVEHTRQLIDRLRDAWQLVDGIGKPRGRIPGGDVIGTGREPRRGAQGERHEALTVEDPAEAPSERPAAGYRRRAAYRRATPLRLRGGRAELGALSLLLPGSAGRSERNR